MDGRNLLSFMKAKQDPGFVFYSFVLLFFLCTLSSLEEQTEAQIHSIAPRPSLRNVSSPHTIPPKDRRKWFGREAVDGTQVGYEPKSELKVRRYIYLRILCSKNDEIKFNNGLSVNLPLICKNLPQSVIGLGGNIFLPSSDTENFVNEEIIDNKYLQTDNDNVLGSVTRNIFGAGHVSSIFDGRLKDHLINIIFNVILFDNWKFSYDSEIIEIICENFNFSHLHSKICKKIISDIVNTNLTLAQTLKQSNIDSISDVLIFGNKVQRNSKEVSDTLTVSNLFSIPNPQNKRGQKLLKRSVVIPDYYNKDDIQTKKEISVPSTHPPWKINKPPDKSASVQEFQDSLAMTSQENIRNEEEKFTELIWRRVNMAPVSQPNDAISRLQIVSQIIEPDQNRNNYSASSHSFFSSAFYDSYLCYTPPPCKMRSNSTGHSGTLERPSCRCDERCSRFNDCCHYLTEEGYYDYPEAKYSYYFLQKEISCRSMPPPLANEASFMVDSCPTNFSAFLSERCSKQVSKKDYLYLLDVPVVSNATGILYANIFCAKCHDVIETKSLQSFLSCKSTVAQGLESLEGMDYEPGNLTWHSEREICVLNVYYDWTDIRWCPKNVVEQCSSSWEAKTKNSQKIKDFCYSDTYYVQYGNNFYKNPHCAICNNVNAYDLKCISSVTFPEDSSSQAQLTVSDLLIPCQQCKEEAIWDPIYEECRTVSNLESNDSIAINCSKKFDEEDAVNISALYSLCKTVLKKNLYTVLYPNGSIYLRKSKLYFHYGEYEVVDDKWIKICKPDGRWTKSMRILSTILITISLICLALHMAIFIALPKRRNIPSMNLFSLTLSLFASELIFECFFHYNKIAILCQIFSALLYYFLSAAFIWMNVMSIDICRTFRSNRYKSKSKKVFVQYSIYAWVGPFLTTLMVVSVDRFAPKDFYFIPDLGSERCWFNNIWGHAVFFTIPAGIIVIINMVLYGLSVWGIYKQHKLGKLAADSIQHNDKKNITVKDKENQMVERKSSLAVPITSTANSDLAKRSSSLASETSNSGPSFNPKRSSLRGKIISSTENFFQEKIRLKIQRKVRANRKHRLRLALYSKLALIMGMTWIFAFMSIHTKSITLEYLFIIFNGLQGALIFLAFDCKKKVWSDLREKFGWKVSKSFDLSRNEESKSYTEGGFYTQTEKITFQCTSSLSRSQPEHTLQSTHEDFATV